jgi:hypothetical protein
MHGILTETALNAYATPRVYKEGDIRSHFPNGIPAKEPSIFYERPWLGGKWGVRDAIEYMLTADRAILHHASVSRSDYLLKAWQMARASIEAGEKGGPFAYVVPAVQHDAPTALEMLDRLHQGGLEVRRATAAFEAGGKMYPAGSWVLLAGQAFRPYLIDLMEPQKYPEVRSGGAPKRPYDIAGWTLPMQMGVAVDRIGAPFQAATEVVTDFRRSGSVHGSGPVMYLDHRENNSFTATAALLERGARVRWTANGAIAVENGGDAAAIAREFGAAVSLGNAPSSAAYEIQKPRLALYQPWQSNMDQGWTQWVLDKYRVPYTIVHNQDFRKGDLAGRFDTVLMASQNAASLLHGTRHGELAGRDGAAQTVTTQRPEYRGGIRIEGLAALQEFVSDGGTLIALDAATELPIEYFPLAVRNAAREEPPFWCPGSLLRYRADSSHPIAFGMPEDVIGFSTGGQAFEVALGKDYNKGEREIQSALKYAAKDLLASGWVSGDRAVLGKHAILDARFGKGRVVLFGLRPQFRGQPFGTFKLLLNAIYLGSAKQL